MKPTYISCLQSKEILHFDQPDHAAGPAGIPAARSAASGGRHHRCSRGSRTGWAFHGVTRGRSRGVLWNGLQPAHTARATCARGNRVAGLHRRGATAAEDHHHGLTWHRHAELAVRQLREVILPVRGLASAPVVGRIQVEAHRQIVGVRSVRKRGLGETPTGRVYRRHARNCLIRAL